MPFGLTIGTERATALQNAIGEELMKRGYSADNDQVMAEYIIIMIINNKTPDVISSELEDLIGPDFDRSFTEWLFAEAAKGAPDSELYSQTQTQSSETQSSPTTSNSAREAAAPSPSDTRRHPPSGPRGGAPLYQQAISQALPNSSPTAQKRTASARSPSPTGQGPSKARRTDVPVGPRAMLREGRHGGPSGQRSLLERVGGLSGRNGHSNNGFARNDDIQSRIDNITGSPDMNMQAALAAGFVPPNMNGMDMNAMAAAQMGGNPMMMGDFMTQMAMMAQLAQNLTNFGMMNNPQFMNGNGFPMQGGMPDMGGYGGGFQGAPQTGMGGGGGRGRGGRGGYSGRGRGGRPSSPRPAVFDATTSDEQPSTLRPEIASGSSAVPIVAPAATPVVEAARPAFAVPDRPQSPTLCKFALKCTNAHCRWSHPSPVATPESGVVLSNEACEQGKNCKDKDCIKAHVSPAAANPELAVEPKPHAPAPPPTFQPHTAIPCRYGASCTRHNCQFQHPPSHRLSHGHAPQQPQPQQQACRYGTACTRATCQFQHPEGRILPSTFHRGLSNTGPMVNISAPPTGSMGGPSQHRSVVFNSAKSGEKSLEQKMREVEEEKKRAVQAVKDAEEAAGKKDADAKPSVAIAV